MITLIFNKVSYWISKLLYYRNIGLSSIPLHKVIAVSTFATVNSCRSFSLLEAIVISLPNSLLSPIINIKQRGQERQLLLLQSWKSDKCMESNSEKSNIDIAILEKKKID